MTIIERSNAVKRTIADMMGYIMPRKPESMGYVASRGADALGCFLPREVLQVVCLGCGRVFDVDISICEDIRCPECSSGNVFVVTATNSRRTRVRSKI